MSTTENPTVSVTKVMQQAATAFPQYRKSDPEKRAQFLETIAANIEALGDELIRTAAAETQLPAARLQGERGRTTGQLRMFARMLREGSWVEATIDTAIPDKIPPRPDIRKMLVPIGPVVVFGASNFPFAYSTAGGDTASALAAGCPVVVKAHPAHIKTSILVAGAVYAAMQVSGMPAYTFQHVTEGSFETGKALVQDLNTAAVGFTGSFKGGKALYAYAASRENPIPVFAEMGSTNPVIFFPDALQNHAASLARQYAGSITLGMGQFCTNPGILLAMDSPGLTEFLKYLGTEIASVLPAPMLHKGIHIAYLEKMQTALHELGVELVGSASTAPGAMEALPVVAKVTAGVFLRNPVLREEVFGPYSLMVVCADAAELEQVWRSVKGQLTTTLMGTETDFQNHRTLIEQAQDMAGRILFNGVPTGVEVCPSMVHGGPFPATTDSRFTAVGIQSVKRWVRPVCYQNCPPEWLPEALKDNNPLQIWRLVNNGWMK